MKTIIPFLLADGGYCELLSGKPPRDIRTEPSQTAFIRMTLVVDENYGGLYVVTAKATADKDIGDLGWMRCYSKGGTALVDLTIGDAPVIYDIVTSQTSLSRGDEISLEFYVN